MCDAPEYPAFFCANCGEAAKNLANPCWRCASIRVIATTVYRNLGLDTAAITRARDELRKEYDRTGRGAFDV